MTAGNTKRIMHHQDLTVGDIACADADDRDGQRFGHAFCQLNRNALQHQQLRTCGF
ncbi:hypothetical protein D3C81_2080330 [compost metagenome]